MKTFFRVSRNSSVYGSGLPVSIYINGEYMGNIPPPAPGPPKDFELPGAGSYEIYFKIDGCKSAVHKTQLNYGEYQTLEVELPEIPLFSWVFRRSAYGRLVPRSPAISGGAKTK